MVATALWREGHTVAVLDPNAESFRRLPPELQGQATIGDGMLEDDLRKAGIAEVDAFIAVASRDTANALAAQMAKYVFRVSKVVCRLNDPPRYTMYTELGLEAVSPTHLVSDLILKAIRT